MYYNLSHNSTSCLLHISITNRDFISEVNTKEITIMNSRIYHNMYDRPPDRYTFKKMYFFMDTPNEYLLYITSSKSEQLSKWTTFKQSYYFGHQGVLWVRFSHQELDTCQHCGHIQTWFPSSLNKIKSSHKITNTL